MQFVTILISAALNCVLYNIRNQVEKDRIGKSNIYNNVKKRKSLTICTLSCGAKMFALFGY